MIIEFDNNGSKYQVDLHAIVNADISVKEGYDIAHKLKDTLITKFSNLGGVLIHIMPNS
ncbi:hypothetical protein DHD05_14605 [Arenibacter sp. N53]|uniref:cation transporter dimerization domain-containing protein n=1 Tax=Arenibacter TaxID=178469 RepID=UPI000CD4208E|nr:MULTISPECIES: cation transporter dimerization domain-containing protein [Arenibacter]MCM4152824.1 hypothetical protein [Arenibacter sp. N53]